MSLGPQLAVYRDGQQVVDLWAGDGVAGDSLFAVFSATKGAAHLVVLLVQEGVLDLDHRVGNLNAPSPTDLVAFANSRQTRALGPASAGGVANARGLAALYAAAVSGLDGKPPLLSPATITEFSRLHTPGTDLVTGDVNKFALGFEAVPLLYPALGPDAFGHSGAAGSQAFADPRSGIAYGYARRRLPVPAGAAPENERLIPAVLQCARFG